MQIRQAAKTHLSDIVKLSHALFQEDSGQRDKTVNRDWALAYGQPYFSQFIEREQRLCLVAIVDQMVVGYLAGYVREASDYRLVKTAELESIFIQKHHRGQGVGTALAQQFNQWAEENGANMITVTAYATNQPAIRFYQTLDFRPHQTTLAYHPTKQ